MVAGDVVNTAARMQAAAPVDGVLVGETTYRATRDAIGYREPPPFEAKGKAEPVPVWEAVEPRSRLRRRRRRAHGDAAGRTRAGARASASPLARVRGGAFGPARHARRRPGNRQVAARRRALRARRREPELITWRQGRCLPYGEGVTLLGARRDRQGRGGDPGDRRAGGGRAEAARRRRPARPDEPRRAGSRRELRPLVGLSATAASARGRGRDGGLAPVPRGDRRARPAVLVFEDLHWADDGLLDFLDDARRLAPDVPLLIVGTARPELLERRPAWGGGKANATTISLQPLGDDDIARLIAASARAARAAGRRAARAARAGRRQPALRRAVRPHAHRARRRRARLPESVQGVIAARLDALPRREKELLQEAAVLGKLFWLGGVASALRARRRRRRTSSALARTEGLRPARAALDGRRERAVLVPARPAS